MSQIVHAVGPEIVEMILQKPHRMAVAYNPGIVIYFFLKLVIRPSGISGKKADASLCGLFAAYVVFYIFKIAVQINSAS